MSPKRGEKSITFSIPEDLHKKFKAKCSMEGKAMRDVLLEFIKKFLEERK
jgi:hypothetical protein